MTVYIQLRHLRALNYCVHGIRRFCVLNNIEFRKLAKGEVTVEEFEATGQHHGAVAAKYARDEVKRGW